MLIRAFIVVTFIAAFASFGYGFWLVLAPEGHNWRVDIPLDTHDAEARRQPGDADSDETDKTAATPRTEAPRVEASQAEASRAAPPKSAAPVPSTAAAPRPAAGDPAGTPPITLELPIACDPGVDCWVINFVDMDPTDAWQDYRCGRMSYDGHKGTDIALANEADIRDTVPVLAAVAGKVVAMRDGEPDAGRAGFAAARAARRECGNAVVVDSGDGWVTQYCHMRKNSVVVREGQDVEAGDVLGAVGLSGTTEFPHVHLQVSHNGAVVDPFRGVGGGEECGLGTQPLWAPAVLSDLVSVRPPFVVDAAFYDAVPSADRAAAGDAERLSVAPDAEALVLWFRAAGVRPGDTARMVITTPDGKVIVDRSQTFDRHQILSFGFFGWKNKGDTFPDGLPLGEWKGRIVLEREGRETSSRTVAMTVAVSG